MLTTLNMHRTQYIENVNNNLFKKNMVVGKMSLYPSQACLFSVCTFRKGINSHFLVSQFADIVTKYLIWFHAMVDVY